MMNMMTIIMMTKMTMAIIMMPRHETGSSTSLPPVMMNIIAIIMRMKMTMMT